jgi:diguanylate cyclase (GGDEF)-like protein
MINSFGRTKSAERRRAGADKGKSIPFWTLGRKVVAAHLAHAILLIILLGCGSYRVVWGYVREKQPNNLKTKARMIAGLVVKDVADLGLIVERMIECDAVLKYKTSYNQLALERHLTQYADKFRRISFFNADGVEVFRLLDGRLEDSLQIAPDGRFLPAAGIEPNRVHVFTPATASAPDVPILELAYRHVDFFDESVGSIVAGVSLQHLSKATLSAIDTKDSTIAIIDREGHLVLATEASRPPGLSAELESLLTRSDVAFGRHRLFGKNSLVARVRIPDLSWTVLVAQPEEIFYADIRKLTWDVLIVLFAMSGGGLLLAFYVARGIVRPVLMLNEKISHVSGSEDLTQRVQWASKDEFGLLADSYNKMLVRLHEAHNHMVHSQEKISHLAFHDSLTKLPNRAMLMQALESALAQAGRDGGRLAVLFLDLDDFKLVNDTMGHEVGDQLLCAVANRLRNALRKNDFFSRPGGDEFIVFMGHYGEAGRPQSNDFIYWASDLARRIIEIIKEPFLIQDYETYVSTSIGISIYPDDAVDARTLLQHADSALYRAKDLGGGQVRFYSSEFSQLQRKRMSLATKLHKAVERNEFVLFFQPVVDLAEGAIVGAEALLRWQTDEGIVSPGEFIPLAEETGLILPIGNWVIDEACRQIREWNEEGVPLSSLSVNLSPRQFWHGDIVSQLLKAVEDHKVLPENLELEVTESSVMKEPLRMEGMLKALHAKGFNLSLDDFGTGYSSLLRLKNLPIGKLKIDKSFVEETPFNENNESLITAIVQLSRNLGIHAQAEGIETVDQWRYLRNLGCRYGQGYFFSPPVPAAEIADMIRCEHRWEIPQGPSPKKEDQFSNSTPNGW